MADAERVVLAFAAGGEGREACVLFNGVQLVPPAREHLMRIRLVPHIPDQAVIGSVEHVMQGNRELDGAQSCGKMPAAGRDTMNQKLAQFPCQFGQFCRGQAAQIRRRGDGVKQGIAGRGNVHIAPVYTAVSP